MFQYSAVHLAASISIVLLVVAAWYLFFMDPYKGSEGYRRIKKKICNMCYDKRRIAEFFIGTAIVIGVIFF